MIFLQSMECGHLGMTGQIAQRLVEMALQLESEHALTRHPKTMV